MISNLSGQLLKLYDHIFYYQSGLRLLVYYIWYICGGDTSLAEWLLTEIGLGRQEQGVTADNRLLQGGNDLSDSQQWNGTD